ncbi:sarcosine oxidase subunit gamma [Saccharopolyspora indica]|uniref:sarcosine oxidase subunit gamma n=1 Tax=Saccharopolyspora indica TaxID=1229659 RepID=UPI0022EB8791|nr:sarcosine oxidase subunit gamma family protein [Saccharopolyspora indica]MDA3646809.1 sarcosine oxidase subunit gamma [Saccharopolyspora indica]
MTVASQARRKADTLRRSPLAARADELAARSGAAVALAEEPFLTQVNLRVHPGSPAVARIEHALNLALPHHEPNLVSGDETAAALWLGPDEWLLIGPDGRAPTLLPALAEALADSLGSTVDVSASRTALRLSGPRSRDVLEKLCSLDLHPRSFPPTRCAQTLVGRTQAILWHLDHEPTYRLLVRNSYAPYLADLLLDAMHEFTPE